MQIGQGDIITASVSHQIKIGRDESWVKFELGYRIKPGDDLDTIEDEVVEHVNTKVMESVETTVEKVRSKS